MMVSVALPSYIDPGLWCSGYMVVYVALLSYIDPGLWFSGYMVVSVALPSYIGLGSGVVVTSWCPWLCLPILARALV